MPRKKKDGPSEAIIVESPTKIRSLRRFLGDRYKLLATKGHIRDLPERGLAVDIEHGFTPTYEIIPGQKKTVEQLKREVNGLERVYLACDPDREGEAIAWHASESLGLEPDRRARVEFNEITERAVREALEHPHDIDFNRVNAQQARRILDRLVGYLLSPLLQQRLGGWRRGSALSAGRVQSAALKLIVDRERERAAFVPREYWKIRALLRPVDRDERFEAELSKYRGKPIEIPDKKRADEITEDLRQQKYVVAAVEKKEQRQSPPPPFRTSTMQREAANRLGWRAGRTMRVAQQLYEGVDLPEGTAGLITYMRTDSTRVAPEAREAARKFIMEQWGEQYVGPGSRGRAPRGAQEAHEAIRPTDVTRTPESIAAHLTPDQLKLYTLIWQRFVASQMAPAVYDRTRVEVAAGDYTLVATGRVLKFPGWRLIYGAETPEESSNGEQNGGEGAEAAGPEAGQSAEAGSAEERGDRKADQDVQLPELHEGEELSLLELKATQHFTQPPPRYTEATLVAELERHGIGRPSTYAPIIDTLRQRKYVRMQKRAFVPTALGIAVCEYLERFFPQIVDKEFTARMEEKLDEIEAGRMDWRELLEEFYEQFRRWLEEAENAPPRVLEGQKCPKCGGRLVERFSRYGRFASCENYPECDYTRDLGITISDTCPKCGAPLEVVVERSGAMAVRCSNAECDYVREGGEKVPAGGTEVSAGAAEGTQQGEGSGEGEAEKRTCPECGGELTLRTNRRGQQFWGCSNYPQCRYTESADGARPQAVETDLECPECGGKLVARFGRQGWFLGCSNYPKCRYARDITEAEAAQYLSEDQRAQKAPARRRRTRRVETELECPECGAKLVARLGRRGWFLGCSNYPKCRFTRNLEPEERERYIGGQEEAAQGVEEGEETAAAAEDRAAEPAAANPSSEGEQAG